MKVMNVMKVIIFSEIVFNNLSIYLFSLDNIFKIS